MKVKLIDIFIDRFNDNDYNVSQIQSIMGICDIPTMVEGTTSEWMLIQWWEMIEEEMK